MKCKIVNNKDFNYLKNEMFSCLMKVQFICHKLINHKNGSFACIYLLGKNSFFHIVCDGRYMFYLVQVAFVFFFLLKLQKAAITEKRVIQKRLLR